MDVAGEIRRNKDLKGAIDIYKAMDDLMTRCAHVKAKDLPQHIYAKGCYMYGLLMRETNFEIGSVNDCLNCLAAADQVMDAGCGFPDHSACSLAGEIYANQLIQVKNGAGGWLIPGMSPKEITIMKFNECVRVIRRARTANPGNHTSYFSIVYKSIMLVFKLLTIIVDEMFERETNISAEGLLDEIEGWAKDLKKINSGPLRHKCEAKQRKAENDVLRHLMDLTIPRYRATGDLVVNDGNGAKLVFKNEKSSLEVVKPPEGESYDDVD